MRISYVSVFILVIYVRFYWYHFVVYIRIDLINNFFPDFKFLLSRKDLVDWRDVAVLMGNLVGVWYTFLDLDFEEGGQVGELVEQVEEIGLGDGQVGELLPDFTQEVEVQQDHPVFVPLAVY